MHNKLRWWQCIQGPAFVVIATVLVGSQAHIAKAQDIGTILKKPAISAVDRGVLETELGQRVKRLFGNAAALTATDARTKLVQPTKEKDVTKAGLDAYADVLAGELDRYVGQPEFNQALVATLVLKELESVKTVDSLVTALKSPHRAVRFAAVQGLQALRPRFKDDETVAGSVLTALGKAGADEKDEQVLRRVYETLNFKTVAAEFKFNDQAAAALSEIFAARLRQLAGGMRDEYRDEEGYAAAASCYPGASPARQAALIGALYGFLRISLDHYFDSDVPPEAVPVVIRRIQRLEKAIGDMISASKGTPPRSIAERLKSGDRQKQEKEARAGLEELHGILKGEPWKLP